MKVSASQGMSPSSRKILRLSSAHSRSESLNSYWEQRGKREGGKEGGREAGGQGGREGREKRKKKEGREKRGKEKGEGGKKEVKEAGVRRIQVRHPGGKTNIQLSLVRL